MGEYAKVGSSILMQDAQNEQPLRAAVVGLGMMGRHHVRVYSEMPSVELVGVADVDPNFVASAVRGRSTRGYTDLQEMLITEKPDLISVAVPTSLHHPIVLDVIEHGVHVLVEKPIAATLAEAESMVSQARSAGTKLMVGHIERFNPAILELRQRLPQLGKVYQATARRIGPFPSRIQDVGVVMDLASHDIDVMRYVIGDPVERVYAATGHRVHSTYEDMIFGLMHFSGGVVGALDVNWLTPTKIRELMVVGSNGTFIANYLTQDLTFHENGASGEAWPGLATIRGISEGNAVRYALRRREPLRDELEAFVAYVLGAPCPTSPEDAVVTLAVALDLIASAEMGKPVDCLGAKRVTVPNPQSAMPSRT